MAASKAIKTVLPGLGLLALAAAIALLAVGEDLARERLQEVHAPAMGVDTEAVGGSLDGKDLSMDEAQGPTGDDTSNHTTDQGGEGIGTDPSKDPGQGSSETTETNRTGGDWRETGREPTRVDENGNVVAGDPPDREPPQEQGCVRTCTPPCGDAWHRESDKGLLTPVHDLHAAWRPVGEILIVGGYNETGELVGGAQMYDPRGGTSWQAIPDDKEGRDPCGIPPMVRPSVFQYNGTYRIMGGKLNDSLSDTIYLWQNDGTPHGVTTSNVKLPYGMSHFGVHVKPGTDGRVVYLIGGQREDGPSAQIIRFDLRTGASTVLYVHHPLWGPLWDVEAFDVPEMGGAIFLATSEVNGRERTLAYLFDDRVENVTHIWDIHRTEGSFASVLFPHLFLWTDGSDGAPAGVYGYDLQSDDGWPVLHAPVAGPRYGGIATAFVTWEGFLRVCEAGGLWHDGSFGPYTVNCQEPYHI